MNILDHLPKSLLPAIARLESMLFEAPLQLDALTKLVAGPAFVGHACLDEGGRPLAYLLGHQTGDEAEILSLGTDPLFQRCGHARAVLDRFLTSMAELGVAQIRLEVACDNQAALTLYRHAGFDIAGARPGYYRRGKVRCDALIMLRSSAAPFP